MLQDLRFALRTLLRSPLFTTVAVLSLALGVGANTAIFSLLNQVLFRSLPVRDAERIVLFDFKGVSEGSAHADSSATPFSYPMYREFRDGNQAFDGLIARSYANVTAVTHDQPERVQAELISGNFFEVLGVTPGLGRIIGSSDDVTPGGHPVIVISYGYWQRRFSGERAALNQTIRINGLPMTIVGVTPESFRSMVSGQTPDLYMSMAMKAAASPLEKKDPLTDRTSRWMAVFGRLKPGMSREQAQASMGPLYRSSLEADLAAMPEAPPRFRTKSLTNRLVLQPAAQGINQLEQQWKKPLIAVMAMVGLVLLIACANVANLLISRASARRREIAIRIAIGASRMILVRQLLVESLLLSVAGGVMGLGVSYWISQLLIRLIPGDELGGWLTATLDWRLLVFALTLSVISGLLFGIVPALSATRSGHNVAPALKEQGGSVSRGQIRLRQFLVVSQLALSLVLLVAAALFARSFANLLKLDPGFRPEKLLTFGVNPGLSGYKTPETLALLSRVQERLGAMPGVTSVAASQLLPLSNSNMTSNVTVEGYTATEDEDTDAHNNLISAGYFSTLGVPMINGREFTTADNEAGPRVAIVNEAFVRRFFKDGRAIGRHMKQGGAKTKPDIEIVGVVRDSKNNSLREKTTPFFYFPYLQIKRNVGISFVVRTKGNETAAASSVRNAMHEMDANLPLENLGWMTTRIEDSVFLDRLIALLASAFGVLATILAGVGLYGVIAYLTLRRTSEIGIRMALGATQGNILWLVMKEVSLLIAGGLAVGIPCMLLASRLIESELFGIHANDPLMLFSAALVLSSIALLAGYIPARRAMRIEPLQALRNE